MHSDPNANLTDDASAAALLTGAVRPPSQSPFLPGDVIGDYTLIERLGVGGFAKVWRAEQGRGVQREVALKILKMGMDTMEVIARFEQERQALAMMNHPNIARVYDAGASPTGRPYFVMEYVSGVPLTRYCREHHCDIAQRIALMRDVCAGVQHAHQKGIIHRDLKPSNILVTEVDGRPVPKIIDFGIAKAIFSSDPTGMMLVTKDDRLVGTPLYMSPEQAAGGGDVDTRCDVYALGALLYELIAGRSPFQDAVDRSAPLSEMRRRIIEGEIDPPSRYAVQLPDNFRDMDVIALKAMANDRADRYSSAAALGDDLRRYQERQPVEARHPTAFYLIQRWLNRHSTVAAACLMFASLSLAGVVGVLWQKQASDQQAQQADAILEMLLSMVTRAEILRNGSVTEVSSLLNSVAESASRFPATNQRLMRLEKALAMTFIALGDSSQAIPHLKRAEAAAVASHASAEDLLDIRMQLLRKMAIVRSYNTNAVAYADELLTHYTDPPRKALVLAWKAEALLQMQSVEESMRIYAELIPLLENASPPLADEVVVEARQSYARTLRAAGRTAEGLEAAKFTAKLADTSETLGDADRAVALAGLGLEYHRGADYEMAAKYYQRALTLRVPVLGRDHPLSLGCEDALIAVQWAMGKKKESLDQQRNQFTALHDELGLKDVRTLNRFSRLLKAYDSFGAVKERNDLIATTLAPHLNAAGEYCAEVVPLLHRVVGYQRDLGNWSAVESNARDMLKVLSKSEPKGFLSAVASSELARALLRQGRLEEAKTQASSARAAMTPFVDKEPDVRLRWLPLLNEIQTQASLAGR